MNNHKFIQLDGRKVPVSNVKHWRVKPECTAPWGREWQVLETVKKAWEQLDASMVGPLLADDFIYGSHWVAENLDRAGYLDYLPGKFATIRRTGTRPDPMIAVVYESLTPGIFPYVLHLTQGDVECLLTFEFKDGAIRSLYMTDPELFTCEFTFRKGGILDGNGEPRVFTHPGGNEMAGTPMTTEELHAFGVECIAELFAETGARVEKVYKGTCKAYPSIVVAQSDDKFFHLASVRPAGEELEVYNAIPPEDLEEYAETARIAGALPLVMDVELWCFDTNGGTALRGGTFAMNVAERGL